MRSLRYQYVVMLKRDQGKKIDRISMLLCFISLIAFTGEQLRFQHLNYFLCLAVLLLCAGIIRNLWLTRTGKEVRYKTWLLIGGLAWLAMSTFPWIAIFFFLLAFLEYQAKYPLEIGFSPNEVVINSLIKKKIRWSDLNHVILKDGLLTLDFKNNTLLQKETMDDGDSDAGEDEFNQYCHEQLNRRKGLDKDPVFPHLTGDQNV